LVLVWLEFKGTPDFFKQNFLKNNKMGTEITAKRVCNKCDEEKDLKDDFSKNEKNPQGRNPTCKICMKTHYDKVKSEKENEWWKFN
jgi:hypothetical protein